MHSIIIQAQNAKYILKKFNTMTKQLKQKFKAESFFSIEKRTEKLVDSISEKYGEIDASDFKKVTDLTREQIAELEKDPFLKRAWSKVSVPLKTVTTLVSKLDERGVTVPYVTQVSLIIQSILTKKSTDMKKESSALKWIKERLKEKSTYASIASALALFFGIDIESETIEPVALAIVSVLVAYQTIMRERGSKKSNE